MILFRLGSFIVLYSILLIALAHNARCQQITKEEMLFLTPEWEGERFDDGRPKVDDNLLKRMKLVTHEEAWAVMRNAGYKYQYAEGWQVINPDSVLVGRAVTATFMPGRPDIHDAIDKRGKAQGKRGQNTWPVDLLVPGDVYVADQFGLHVDGPTIGDNVGNAIYAKSGNGIVYDGALRDIAGLREMEGFTSYFTSYHPSHHNQQGNLNTMLIGINKPTRIRQVTVMAGDVVLGRDGGVSFIPPHLAERVVVTSEIVRLRDMFGHQRIREGVYTAGQIDTRWAEEIERDFSGWLNDHIDELPVPREQIQEILKNRTW
ncbi:5-carboxymethyl-2-hydroxymuconate delta-isomerase [Lunatimonas lonarensis]|uniref:5-carboxymethyl-2-hydroxymuconate delta-isomerase n=1 Tax=Lunatimonas lonarensis TaxID=1232681 RepID=R7ZQH4_9BACT|nr:5-carboxymethyl-2-hydroxymuconate Delta-isomerase [Lunatimonas lonarensis]EON76376.1 5-carboxymethyl-2-hydroxymuconate delta-isomerase [Lunatimonas lonarensis]